MPTVLPSTRVACVTVEYIYSLKFVKVRLFLLQRQLSVGTEDLVSMLTTPNFPIKPETAVIMHLAFFNRILIPIHNFW